MALLVSESVTGDGIGDVILEYVEIWIHRIKFAILNKHSSRS